MTIGIDGNEANVTERVGVNVWAFEVLKHLQRTENREQRTERHSQITFQIYLTCPPLADLPKETENWKYRVIGPGGLWTRWRLPLDLYFHRFKGSDLASGERSDPLRRPDVFLSLSHYAPKWAPMPRVVCIMDLSFLKFPEAFKPAVRWQLMNWTRESVKNAAHILTISEFNKQEIAKTYGYPDEKISVIYPGVSEAFKNFYKGQSLRGQSVQGLSFSGRYLLFVGTKQPKKNLGRLVEAFGRVREKFPEVTLVVVGKVWSQFASEKFAKPSSWREVSQTSQTSQVKYLGYVAEKDLPGLAAGAEAVVLPSLYEGFGIPAAEAMSAGTPVLASNATSLPEIIGDAGILFDPYDIKDMADKICRLLAMSKAERQRLVEKGKIRARKFDWEKAADSIMRSLIHIADARSLDFVPTQGRDFARDDEIK